MPLKTLCKNFSLGDICSVYGNCPHVSMEGGLDNIEFRLGADCYDPGLDFYIENPDKITPEELEDLRCYAKLENKQEWLEKIDTIKTIKTMYKPPKIRVDKKA